ncbi:MAG TPA: hypothetical protein VJ888_10390 [Mobilitalea sp.]|nr:hypothetical protein [Mobilitalea sp.]
MAMNSEMENIKIGSVIQYFRDSYGISQSILCRGLCSVTTLSRIEADEREADELLLETLLERLGKTPNQFELILTNLDYVLYQNREEIKEQISNKNYDEAYKLLDIYEKEAASKGSVHKQFIVASKAMLNEEKGGAAEKTLELLMKAISYTVPDYKSLEIENIYLSNIEFIIMIQIIQKMIYIGTIDGAKKILFQLIAYFDIHPSMEGNRALYPQLAIIACRLLIQERKFSDALEICNKGLKMNKGNRKLDYLGDLYLLQAQITEEILKSHDKWNKENKECLKTYLQAYYVYEFCEEKTKTEEIRKHIQEEYGWEDID